MWQIADNKGVIHQGTEKQMRDAWNTINAIINNKPWPIEKKRKWARGWNGTLKLIQIHDTIQ